MKRIILAAAACLLMTSNAYASNDLNTIDALAQPAFRAFSEDLASALSYKSVSPAEPQGITGFDIGVELTGTKMANADIWWREVTGDSSVTSTLPLTRLHAHKGLPFGIDVGFSITSVPGSNINVTGGEIRYAILRGNVAMPAIAIRATSSRLSGVDQLNLTNTGYELAISKGFLLLTPYAGIGRIKSDSKPKGTAALALSKESFTSPKTFVGLNINLGVSNIGLEVDKTGDNTSYTIKYGLRW